MTKEEVQQRVLHNGKPLDLELFTWDEKANTFSSIVNNLIIDFRDISYCTFKTGYDCTFKTGSDCTFTTGSDCTFKTGSDCTFKTGYDCTFKTGYDCTFKTGYGCTFNTWKNCTFDTGSNCTFTTGSNCTFDTGENSVIVRRDIFEIIVGRKNIKLCPFGIKGYLYLEKEKWIYSETWKESIIADGILGEVLSKKKNKNIVIYTVINHREKEKSYIIEENGIFSHGETIEQAKESLVYKISNKDTSKFESYNLDTILTFKEQVEFYRTITGACESGCKYFVETNNIEKKDRTIKEIIEITKNQYNNIKLIKFMEIINE